MSATLIHGDCRTVLSGLPDESVDAVVTSPWYNVGKRGEERMPFADYLAEMRVIVGEVARLVRPGGSVWWQVGNAIENGEVIPLDWVFGPMFRESGLASRNRVVWTFGHGLHCTNRLSGRHETILWLTKGRPALQLDAIRVPQQYPNKRYYKGPRKGELSCNPLGKNPGDVWDIPNVKHNHPEKTAHPCQFPEELVERCLRASTRPGDLVLDPFTGSGTTGVVAANLGRDFLGIESADEYVAIARARLGGAA